MFMVTRCGAQWFKTIHEDLSTPIISYEVFEIVRIRPHHGRPRTQMILIGICGETSCILPKRRRWSRPGNRQQGVRQLAARSLKAVAPHPAGVTAVELEPPEPFSFSFIIFYMLSLKLNQNQEKNNNNNQSLKLGVQNFASNVGF
jgi:hypothetical protein